MGRALQTGAGAGGLAQAMILLAQRNEHGGVLGSHLFGAIERLARLFKSQIGGGGGPKLEPEIDDRRISLYQVSIRGVGQGGPSGKQLLLRLLPLGQILRRLFELGEVRL